MFTTRFALLTLVTAAVVSVALVLLLDATPVIAVFSGLAAGALAAILPVAVGDGRFPGTHSGRRAVASFLVLGSALAVPPTLGLTRGAQLSLSILILVVGSAAFLLGSATVIEEIET